MFYKRGIAPLLIVLIVAGTLFVGGGTYTGVSFYQSKKLVAEGEKLMDKGKYADALDAFEKAGKKFMLIKGRIASKVAEAEEFRKQEENIRAGEESISKGEWQKCLEFFNQVAANHPDYESSRAHYSDCEKRLAEESAAVVANSQTAAEIQPSQADSSSASSRSASSANSVSEGNTSSSQSTDSGSPSLENTGSSDSPDSESTTPIPTETPQAQTRPVLYLPFSGAIMPDGLMPMGETINHPKPQNPDGHPGIDFQWNNPSGLPVITASMDATVTGIRASDSHAGAYDVATRSGLYEVDYTEMGSVTSGLTVGDNLHVGDAVGTPQHPAGVTDQPNYRMIHWQFGYGSEDTSLAFSVRRLCPMTYFATSAKSTIEAIWSTTDWPEMKENAPNICSGNYTE